MAAAATAAVAAPGSGASREICEKCLLFEAGGAAVRLTDLTTRMQNPTNPVPMPMESFNMSFTVSESTNSSVYTPGVNGVQGTNGNSNVTHMISGNISGYGTEATILAEEAQFISAAGAAASGFLRHM